jgi:hypothetical protein
MGDLARVATAPALKVLSPNATALRASPPRFTIKRIMHAPAASMRIAHVVEIDR